MIFSSLGILVFVDGNLGKEKEPPEIGRQKTTQNSP
jgi:hypothetical protein